MDNSAPINIEIKWADHMNSSWASKDCDNLANRDTAQSMYDALIYNKEIRVTPPPVLTYNDVQLLPDYQIEPLSVVEIEKLTQKLDNTVSFMIHHDGSVSACGKGSYGRLGLGNSAHQAIPKQVLIDSVVKKLSSSKGSDGHTLALTEDGMVYSYRHSAAVTDDGGLDTWGEGDHGRLGHGDSNSCQYTGRWYGI
ncbi:hypothetical protein RN001_007048 [Aquatica leii]|uniref:Uncharacterized protein n=1 Tax=Aquatica leii TaxID=1421715 RepID=A0AAN7Q2I4_9COLE|nr:hypothetical protein RN001_007048 [Aquatica leii]